MPARWGRNPGKPVKIQPNYGFLPPAYEATRTALAKQCFGGFIAHVDGGFSKKLDPFD